MITIRFHMPLGKTDPEHVEQFATLCRNMLPADEVRELRRVVVTVKIKSGTDLATVLKVIASEPYFEGVDFDVRHH